MASLVQARVPLSPCPPRSTIRPPLPEPPPADEGAGERGEGVVEVQATPGGRQAVRTGAAGRPSAPRRARRVRPRRRRQGRLLLQAQEVRDERAGRHRSGRRESVAVACAAGPGPRPDGPPAPTKSFGSAPTTASRASPTRPTSVPATGLPPPSGSSNRGVRRLILGLKGEVYYSADSYETILRVR